MRAGRGLEPAARRRDVSAEALGNSPSAGEPHGGISPAVPLLLAFCRLQIVWHQQTLFVSGMVSLSINLQEGLALLCPG